MRKLRLRLSNVPEKQEQVGETHKKKWEIRKGVTEGTEAGHSAEKEHRD